MSNTLAALSWDAWEELETWALEDSVPKFTLPNGVVLWRRMTLEVAELLRFTPEELRARWLALGGPQSAATQLQDGPPLLEDWVCTAPGRYEGSVHNLPALRDGSLRATVEHDDEADAAENVGGCSAEALDGQRRWVRTKAGVLFELGAPRDAATDAATDAAAEGPIESAASFARALVGIDDDAGMTRGLDGASAVGGALAKPAVLTAGAMLATAAAAFALFGHHINVSVFIV